MKFKIHNIIKYQFSNPISYGVQRLRLWPRETPNQSEIDWHIDYVGAQEQAKYRDHHNNICTLITFVPGITEMSIRVRGTLKTVQKRKSWSKYSELCPIWIFQKETHFTTAGKSITTFCQNWTNSSLFRIDICREIAIAIKNEIQYKAGETDVLTTAEQAFQKKIGVCQDFTHIFLTCMRQLDIPARYVSGYLSLKEPKIQNATHAWAEVFIERLGWVGFDPANNVDVDESYIMLATGCDYQDANPTNGFQFDSENSSVVNQIEIKKKKNRDMSQ